MYVSKSKIWKTLFKYNLPSTKLFEDPFMYILKSSISDYFHEDAELFVSSLNSYW